MLIYMRIFRLDSYLTFLAPSCLGIIMLAFAQYANALTTQGAASVTIADGLAVQETQILSFGRIIKPTSGTHRVVVRPNGTYNAASAAFTLGQEQQNAIFRITGDADANIVISSSNIQSTITGVTFDSLRHPTSRTLNRRGLRNLNVGGVIIVDSSVVPGVYNQGELSYSITVNYE